jgi:hypothetical protein
MPADVNGEAQPMMPTGGTAEMTSPSGTRQKQAVFDMVHTNAHGAARMALAAIHSSTARANVAEGPKKTRAPGMSGQLAPA